MITLNTHFLKCSESVQKAAKKMLYRSVDGVFIEETDTERKYYTTDGHLLLFYREKIEKKQIEKPIRIMFEKIPATKQDTCDFEIINDKEATITNNKGKTIVQYIYLEDTKDLDEIKKIFEREQNGHAATNFVLFSPLVLEVVSSYMDYDYYTMPTITDDGTPSFCPVMWASPDGDKKAIAMPCRVV